MNVQRQIAEKRAIQVKGQKYGVEYHIEINGKLQRGKTNYGMKTVGDLMNMLLKTEAAQNLKPFDGQDNLLGYSVLLGDIKQHIKIKPIDEEDMIILHFCGKIGQSFMVNKKQLTLQNALDLLNLKQQNLELMGKKITNDMLDRLLNEFVNGSEVCIRVCD